MFVFHRVHPTEAIVNRFESLRNWTIQTARNPKVGLGLGFAVSALAGAPMPLPQLSLLGPFIATCAVGPMGARAAAAVGFLSFIAFNDPTPVSVILAAAIAFGCAWAFPVLVGKALASEERFAESPEEGAAAIVIDCDGFAGLDEVYGPGTGTHVFNLLHRALKCETRSGDMVVNSHGQELVLVLDTSNPLVAQTVMERVEKRFAAWLADAGYECNLSVGMSLGDDVNEIEAMMRSARRPYNEPYLD